MGKPQVTLTLAGDDSALSRTFQNVGSSSQAMADQVGAASKRVGDETADGYDRAGEAADGAEGKAQGFSDVLTGTSDIAAGTGQIMKGNLFEGFVTVGQGAADLAGGLASFLIPAVKNLTKANLATAVQAARTTAATVAQRAVTVAASAASKAAAAAQWLLNAAMTANPIGLVIAALALLVGGFILAYKKSETFRTIVNGALGGVQVAFKALVKAGQVLYSWFRDNIPKVGGFFKSVGGAIAGPFQAAFGAIRSAWNNTVGGKGFDIPGWVPNLGGKSFRIPYFHTGGIVSGAMGSESLSVLRAGERVTAGSNSGGGAGTIVLRSDGSRIGRLMVQVLREAIKIEGGNVQVVLGS